MKLFLREIEESDKKEIEEMALEFKNANDEYPFEGVSNLKKVIEESFEEFYKGLECNKHIDEIYPNWANQTTYVLVDENNHIYGLTNLRHELKGKLFEIGGHVGYAIRPNERGKGFGTLQLQLTLELMDMMNIDRALITCRENNIGFAGFYQHIMESHTTASSIANVVTNKSNYLNSSYSRIGIGCYDNGTLYWVVLMI